MKSYIVFIIESLLVVSLFSQAAISQQNINTSEYFPDPQFRRAVETFLHVEPDQPFSAELAASTTGFSNASCRIFKAWQAWNISFQSPGSFVIIIKSQAVRCSRNLVQALCFHPDSVFTNFYFMDNLLTDISDWAQQVQFDEMSFGNITMNYLDCGDFPDIEALSQKIRRFSYEVQRTENGTLMLDCALEVNNWVQR